MSKHFFDKEDSPHGLAKRVILYRHLQQRFAYLLNSYHYESRQYKFILFDAFAGKGKYNSNLSTEETLPTENEKNEIPFDKNCGSPVVALHALFSIMEKYVEKSPAKVLFIFGDKEKKYVNALKENVLIYLQTRSGVEGEDRVKELTDSEKEIEFQMLNLKMDANRISVKILFCCSKFEDFNVKKLVRDVDSTPMISFVDPFGFSQTPMNRILKLLKGKQKELLITFMVEYIHRFHNYQPEHVDNLMGDSNWRDQQTESQDNSMKYERYQEIYREIMTAKMDNFKSLSFLMRRNDDTGNIYNLIHFADELQSVQSIKYAMAVGSNKHLDLCFADSKFYKEGQRWCPLTNIDDEANFIYQYWEGKKCSFGELKNWILLESPLQIHSKPLLKLEKDKKLEVSNCPKRKRKSFPPKVGWNIYDTDYNNENCKYHWQLEFKSEDSVSADETPMKRSNLDHTTGPKSTKRKLF